MKNKVTISQVIATLDELKNEVGDIEIRRRVFDQIVTLKNWSTGVIKQEGKDRVAYMGPNLRLKNAKRDNDIDDECCEMTDCDDPDCEECKMHQ